MNFSSIFAEPGTEHNTWCLTFWVLQVKLLRLSALSPWLCPYFPVFFSLSPHVCRSVCLQVCRSVFLESLPGLLWLSLFPSFVPVSPGPSGHFPVPSLLPHLGLLGGLALLALAPPLPPICTLPWPQALRARASPIPLPACPGAQE